MLARATSAKQDDINIGIAAQLRDLRAYVVERSWDATGETVEIGVGENSVDRPGLKKILALAASAEPPLDILLAVSADRIDSGHSPRSNAASRRRGLRSTRLKALGHDRPLKRHLAPDICQDGVVVGEHTRCFEPNEVIYDPGALHPGIGP
jgi:hypothetical protein